MLNLLFTFVIIFFTPFSAANAADACTTPAALNKAQLPLRDFQRICREIVRTDPGCLMIKDPRQRMSCNASKGANEIWGRRDLSSKVFQCAKGFVWDSMKGLGQFVVELIETMVRTNIRSVKTMYKFMTDRKYRERRIRNMQRGTAQNAQLTRAFLNSSALYFSREYSKNLRKNPMNPLGALGVTLVKPLLDLLVQAAEAVYEHFMPQYQCLNGPAKVNAICRIGGEIFMPPAILLTFLKHGITGLRALKAADRARIARATQRLNRFSQVPPQTTTAVRRTSRSTTEPLRVESTPGPSLTPSQTVLNDIVLEAKGVAKEMSRLKETLKNTRLPRKKKKQLKQRIEALERKLADLDSQFISTGRRLLSEAGVPTRIVTEEGRTRLIIDATSEPTKNHAFNFFRRAQNEFEVKEISINLKDNLERQRRGFSNGELGRIDIGYDGAINLLGDSVGVTPKHELRHAMFNQHLRNQTTSPFHTKFTAAPDGKKLNPGSSYNTYMSAEEIYTWSTDLQTLAQSMSGKSAMEVLGNVDLMKQIRRRTEKISLLTQAAEELTQSGIASLQKMLANNDLSSLKLLDDDRIEFVDEFQRTTAMAFARSEDLEILRAAPQHSEAKTQLARLALDRLEQLRRISEFQRAEALELQTLIAAFENTNIGLKEEQLRLLQQKMFELAKNVKPDYEGYILNSR